jgi:hypothetical protein
MSSPIGSVRSWCASSTRRHGSGGAPRGRDGRQTAAARAGPLQPRHRLGRRRHRRRKPARRDRPRARGRHHDPAAQAPQTPNGDCPLTARAQHRRERGAGMRGPPPDPGREAARRRSRRKAQATNQSASRLLRTTTRRPPAARSEVAARARRRLCVYGSWSGGGRAARGGSRLGAFRLQRRGYVRAAARCRRPPSLTRHPAVRRTGREPALKPAGSARSAVDVSSPWSPPRSPGRSCPPRTPRPGGIRKACRPARASSR